MTVFIGEKPLSEEEKKKRTEDGVDYDCFSLKMRSGNNDSKTCVIRYQAGIKEKTNCITIFYIGEKAKSLLPVNANSNNVKLDRVKLFLEYSKEGEKIAKERVLYFIYGRYWTTTWVGYASDYYIIYTDHTYTLVGYYDQGGPSYIYTNNRVRLIN